MFKLFRKRKANKYGKHIFTFPNGERLYQLKEDHFEKLPAKKLSYIQENSNYIAFLGISKSTLEVGHRMIKDHAYQITALSEFKDKDKMKSKCMDLVKLVDQIDTTREEYDKANEAIMVSLFDLFFYFEDENIFVWNEETMERKRHFLNTYPYFKSFFFQKLNDYMLLYKVTFQNCINFALIQANVQETVNQVAKELSLTDISLFKTN
jgi:hypothetical protein